MNMNRMTPRLNMFSKRSIIFAATTLGSRLMSNIFFFYIVKISLDTYHMDQFWFQLSQSLYAIWNAINDPWFAYIQDNSKGWMRIRRKCILYGAIPWVISFMLPWFPWADYSIPSNGFISFLQVLISLCLFDTFFTFCLLAHCSLVTEYAESESERLTFIKYSGVAGIIGATSVYAADQFSHGFKDLPIFQLVCVVISILSVFCLFATGYFAETKYDSDLEDESKVETDAPEPYWTLTKQIFQNWNFIIFVAMNFLQELHITYVLNFSKIFTDTIIPDSHAAHWIVGKSFLLGILVVLPQILVLVASPVIKVFGLYNVQVMSFYVKLILGVFTLLLGPTFIGWFICFLILDYGLSDGMFSFFSVTLSDIADEHQKEHNRSKPIASMIFGTNALVVKPALSFAPMIVSAYIEYFGYSRVKEPDISIYELIHLQTAMFYFSALCPIIVGGLQIFIWRQYKLRGSHPPLGTVWKEVMRNWFNVECRCT